MTTYYTGSTSSNSTADFGGAIRFSVRFHVHQSPPPAPPPIPKPWLEACRVLGVTPPLEWPEVQKSYRRLARANHPDAGGDAERMKAINAAFDLLKSLRPPE